MHNSRKDPTFHYMAARNFCSNPQMWNCLGKEDARLSESFYIRAPFEDPSSWFNSFSFPSPADTSELSSRWTITRTPLSDRRLRQPTNNQHLVSSSGKQIMRHQITCNSSHFDAFNQRRQAKKKEKRDGGRESETRCVAVCTKVCVCVTYEITTITPLLMVINQWIR